MGVLLLDTGLLNKKTEMICSIIKIGTTGEVVLAPLNSKTISLLNTLKCSESSKEGFVRSAFPHPPSSLVITNRNVPDLESCKTGNSPV